MLNTYQNTEDCCSDALAIDLLDMPDTAEVWHCPDCGCQWRRMMVDSVAHWMPYEFVELVRHV